MQHARLDQILCPAQQQQMSMHFLYILYYLNKSVFTLFWHYTMRMNFTLNVKMNRLFL